MDWRSSTTRRFLRGGERRRLLEALEQLHGFGGDLTEYAVFITGLLRELLCADLADYGEFHPKTGRLGGVYWTEGTSYETRVVAHLEHMATHPVFFLDEQLYGEQVLGNGDFFSDREFQAMPIFCDSFRPDGLRHFLNTCVVYEGWVVSHGVYRAGGAAFSRHDQALFAAIYPHLRAAYEAARGRTVAGMALRERIDWLWPGLSIRQREVFEGIASGWSNGEIAEGLRLDVNTVKTYQKVLFERFNVRNRTELALMVYRENGGMVLTGRCCQ